jgi:hypothetical protein
MRVKWKVQPWFAWSKADITQQRGMCPIARIESSPYYTLFIAVPQATSAHAGRDLRNRYRLPRRTQDDCPVILIQGNPEIHWHGTIDTWEDPRTTCVAMRIGEEGVHGTVGNAHNVNDQWREIEWDMKGKQRCHDDPYPNGYAQHLIRRRSSSRFTMQRPPVNAPAYHGTTLAGMEI